MDWLNKRGEGKNLEIWGRKIEGAGGCKIAIVGFCRAGDARLCAERTKALGALSFGTEEIVQIDFIIAAKLKELFPEGVPALGASVCIPWLSDRIPATGGVLGNPKAEEQSSRSELEDLGGGLWLYTQPGGPGWVASGPKCTVEAVLKAMKKLDLPRRKLIAWLTEEFERRCPDGFLIVSDGTGIDSCGYVAAGNRSGKIEYNLP